MRALDFRGLSPRNQAISLATVVVFGVLIGFLTDPNDGWDGILRTLTWLSLSLVSNYLIIWFRAYPEIEDLYQQTQVGLTLGLAMIVGLTIGVTLYLRGGTGDVATLSGAVFALYAIFYVSINVWLTRLVNRRDQYTDR